MNDGWVDRGSGGYLNPLIMPITMCVVCGVIPLPLPTEQGDCFTIGDFRGVGLLSLERQSLTSSHLGDFRGGASELRGAESLSVPDQ